VALTLSRTSVAFQAVEEGAAPPEQTVRVTVTGGANPLLGVVRYEGAGRDWLRTSLGAGGGQESTLTLRPEIGGLAAGSHRALLPVEAGGQTREVEIRLEVASKPVATGVEPTAAAEREIGDLLGAYAAAINAKNEARVKDLYPSIPQAAINDLLRIRDSDLFQVNPVRGTLRAGARAETLDIDVTTGIIDDRTGRGEQRRFTYTVGRGPAGWYILGIR